MQGDDDDVPPQRPQERQLTRVGRRGGVLQKVKRELVPLAGYSVDIPALSPDTLWDVWDRQPACGNWSTNLKSLLPFTTSRGTVFPSTAASAAGAEIEEARSPQNAHDASPTAVDRRTSSDAVEEPNLDVGTDATSTASAHTSTDNARFSVALVHGLWVLAALLTLALINDAFPAPFDMIIAAVTILLALPMLMFRLVTMRISITKRLLRAFQVYFFWGTAMFALVSHILAHETASSPSGMCTFVVVSSLYTCIALSDAFVTHRKFYVKAYFLSALGFAVISAVMASRITRDVKFVLWLFPWSPVQSSLDDNITTSLIIINALHTLWKDDSICVFLVAPYTMTVSGLQGRKTSEETFDQVGIQAYIEHIRTRVEVLKIASSDSSIIPYDENLTLLKAFTGDLLKNETHIQATRNYAGFWMSSWALGGIFSVCSVFKLHSSFTSDYMCVAIWVIMLPGMLFVASTINTSLLKRVLNSFEILVLQTRFILGYISFLLGMEFDFRTASTFPAFLSYCMIFYYDSVHHSIRRLMSTTWLPIAAIAAVFIFAYTLSHPCDCTMFTVGGVAYNAMQIAASQSKFIAVFTLKYIYQALLHPSRYIQFRCRIVRSVD